ncbi:MAG: hypothetical protein BJ554DRAFT_4126 [Olpidium bornovanus]|uniref:Guanylate kinase-like domain-containing protein n=1 Tax=Olpidium bornovanus TaxID=278681 RepID=A0A8H7ZNG0_9FUNG|nr:MAG: hypothetical protein BJ554DRAFT_4126 [Olpidium bornovanus]
MAKWDDVLQSRQRPEMQRRPARQHIGSQKCQKHRPKRPPPSVDVLEQRLRERGTETEQAIKDRLAMATAELEYAAQPGTHDLVIVNESLDDAYKQLKEYVVGITGK